MGITNEADVLRANANGFTINSRGAFSTNLNNPNQNDPVLPTLGEVDADGNLTANAEHEDNLKIGSAEGNANITYLTTATSKYTITAGKYRGFSVVEASQEIKAANDTSGKREIDVSGNADKELVLNGMAASIGSITKQKIDVFLSEN